MKRLLIALSVLVFSYGCSTVPDVKPDDIIAATAHFKRDVPAELSLDKIQLPSLHECGEFLCISNLDFKHLEFEIEKIREKLALRHLSDESWTRSYNELVGALASEQVLHAYTRQREVSLQNENTRITVISETKKWLERIIFIGGAVLLGNL